jgi:hypothetical protein
MRRFSLFLVIGLTAALGPFAVTAHAAPKVTCTTDLSSPPNYPGNVVVPSGETCNLQSAKVGGNVTVQPGGRLISGAATVIGGSVTSTNAGTDNRDVLGTGAFDFSVVICNSTIKGNVSISGSASSVLVGGPGCGGNAIAGDVSLVGNKSRNNHLSSNDPTYDCNLGTTCRIGGNATVNGNKFFVIQHNKIYGDLTCRDNVCGLSERYNIVLGVRRGQCVV